MNNVVRMGVIGAGSIAVRGILPHLALDDVQERVRLAAVCDPVPGRAEAAKARFGIDRAFTDYEDLLINGEVDAVTIASPIGLHYEQGKLALEAGKHVHFNKTMTTTTAEATELIELAHAKNLRIVASPGEVLLPRNQRIKQLIAEGALGTLCWVVCGATLAYHENEAVRQGNDPLSNIDPSWYFRKPGGGPLYDVTVYALHGLTSVLGPVQRVTAFSGVRIPERPFKDRMVPCDADDSTLILLDFGENVFGLAYGTAAGMVTQGFAAGSYFGTKGSIIGSTLNGEPLDYPGSKQAALDRDGYGDYRLLPHIVGAHLDIEEMHVYEDIMQLVDWIRDDIPSIVTAEHARHVIEIIDAAYRAAQTGQTQELTTTF